MRTLLLTEDTGFYGHRGIDLRELPSALLTNWSRGASTITQQLAKNLFLSRDKQLGRKLQELAITFLLESALGKDRILEIYLNIIEWGPHLRGLRPAARKESWARRGYTWRTSTSTEASAHRAGLTRAISLTARSIPTQSPRPISTSSRSRGTPGRTNSISGRGRNDSRHVTIIEN